MSETTSLSFTIAAIIALAGCPASDDGTVDGGSDTGSTTPTTSATTMPEGDDTSGTMQPTTGTPTTGDPATGDGSSGEGSGGEGSGESDGGMCDPAADDDECATCVKTSCCAQLEACAEDAACTCFQDCVEMNPGVRGAIGCGGDCNVMIFGEGPTADLVGCSSAPPCAEPCGV